MDTSLNDIFIVLNLNIFSTQIFKTDIFLQKRLLRLDKQRYLFLKIIRDDIFCFRSTGSLFYALHRDLERKRGDRGREIRVNRHYIWYI